MTIIYEVNLSVDADILEEYVAWLQEHVRLMLQFPGFQSAEVFKEEVALNAPQHAFTVHYRLQNRDSLEHYFKENAAAMREDGLRRFGGRFSASRRILELVKP
ncbi:hypothetical protein Lgee_0290 [Legionella geestiana]|uniref:Uncharacterized protein n=1 Tax=Legionella geestiana TaxID=45065 RepID=A0A0W0U8D5_9GAMM|nr:DUF4286 family protein [Legionella geestiana]KTD04047.1 hypothetical protein Lgee_0290 [Legionella geestiana]QBS12062.1 DUF4286 family protein [Legionella geestiana]STX53218.1 Uncharacterised protein [Legionella geestiana]